mmetsp:Transcript_6966/g.12190  ORF Transcript_6966/g.12190 Transcript_6966/m.12190 type:complete len:94 (+) Transcript_6966:794-1075(+)
MNTLIYIYLNCGNYWCLIQLHDFNYNKKKNEREIQLIHNRNFETMYDNNNIYLEGLANWQVLILRNGFRAERLIKLIDVVAWHHLRQRAALIV